MRDRPITILVSSLQKFRTTSAKGKEVTSALDHGATPVIFRPDKHFSNSTQMRFRDDSELQSYNIKGLNH